MSKIYELDISLFDKIYENPTHDKFIFTNKNKRPVVVVDNTSGDFFTEDFSNKTKGLIYLVNDSFMPYDVEKEYSNNRGKYKNYHKVVSNSMDYSIDYNLSDRDFFKFDPYKDYNFSIDLGFGEKEFRSTIKEALGLAINNEADLKFNNALLISPLGFDWEDNKKIIEKYVGRKNLSKGDMFGWNIPYRRPDSKQIEWLKNDKDIKM